ncbi:uncharacterized protein METZ01_LOCUS275557, partial [marine metagenome]
MEKDSNKQLLYQVAETAKVLCCSKRTVSRLVQKGELPKVQVGSSIRIPCKAVQEWVQENT